jgi:hypothetical protein
MATSDVEVGTNVAVGSARRVSMGIGAGVEELDVGVPSSSVGRGVGGVPLAGRLHDVRTKTTKTNHRRFLMYPPQVKR